MSGGGLAGGTGAARSTRLGVIGAGFAGAAGQEGEFGEQLTSQNVASFFDRVDESETLWVLRFLTGSTRPVVHGTRLFDVSFHPRPFAPIMRARQ